MEPESGSGKHHFRRGREVVGMVRDIVLLWIVLSISSCGGGRYLAGGQADRNAPAGEEHEMFQQAIEDPASAQGNFNNLERIVENPVDPRGASLDALLSIPDFPEDLARKIAAAGEKHSGANWVALLTPQEREYLYHYRDYLVLPSPLPLRMSFRLTGSDILVGGGVRKEKYVSSSIEGWKALWREVTSGAGSGAAYYLSGSAFDGALRLHGGSFGPDFALGLVFGGAHQSYVFSSAYPFHNPRGIVGSTSFYSPTVFGGAAEVQYRGVRGAFFGGRAREYRSDRFEVGGKRVCGARFEVQRGGARMGLSCSTGSSGGEGCVCAVDGRWESDRSTLGFEFASAGSGNPALLSAFSCKAGRGARVALFLYAVPPGVSGMFAGINGLTPDASTGVYGATAVAEREVLQRLRVRFAIDRCSRREGFDEKEDRDLRAECEKKWRKVLVKIAWNSKVDDRRDAVPYPGSETDRYGISHSLGLVSDIRLASCTSFKVTLRRIQGEDGGGFLACPLIRVSLFSGHLDASAFIAYYRTLADGAVCYFYEPSLKGCYPWRSASSDTERSSFLFTCKINRLRVSTHAALEVGKPPEGSLQAAWDF
jgi:hypothetical protein